MENSELNELIHLKFLEHWNLLVHNTFQFNNRCEPRGKIEIKDGRKEENKGLGFGNSLV